ncbi:MAG: hypothetical protein M9918_21460 [Anaerolineae bacterium]|nr:hypothetical protein [Anaerolineae bacterium]MCO5195563.1 hypothetical protein [Anaerolineae bacterium]
MNTTTTDLTVIDFHPRYDVPTVAPKPQFDLSDPNLSFDDVLPSNYFSMEGLQTWLDDMGAEARVLTVTAVTMEWVYDPEKGEASGDWKPCAHFDETPTMLVINKSRGEMLKRMASSPLLRDWANVGQIAMRPGIANGKAQIVIEPVPGAAKVKPRPANGESTADFVQRTNDELFG